MKFTASPTYLTYANGAFKDIKWRAYARKTESLSATLVGYSGWFDISGYVETIPTIRSQIEYELGQFSQDSIELVGLNIAWWDANIFNATSSEYIELKIEAQVGHAGSYATDIAYMFFGFVDKVGVRYDEIENTVSFTVLTPEDVGTRIAGEKLSTQYINYDILDDGSYYQGLELQKNRSVFVIDANISSYVLKVGVHTITYIYEDATKKIKLDDGEYVSITTDFTEYTLSNADVTEKIKIYVRLVDELPLSADEIIDKVIVITAGTTLPKQYYSNVGGYRLLQLAYSQIGITSLQFDTLQINTWDSRYLVTWIDIPPADEAISGMKRAITNDGAYLYIGVGTKVYKRTMATNAYTLLTTVTASHNIFKLMHNARNNQLWILFSVDGLDYKIRKLNLSDNTYTDCTMATDGSPCCVELVDRNYTGSSWKYGIVYSSLYPSANGGSIRWIDASTMTDAEIVTGHTISATKDIVINYSYILSGSHYVFTTYNTPAGPPEAWAYEINSSGNWVSHGTIGQLPSLYTSAVFNPIDQTIYYFESGTISSHYYNSATPTTLKSDVTYGFGFYYDSYSELVTCSGYDTTNKRDVLYRVYDSSTCDELDTNMTRCAGLNSLTAIGGVLYGIDIMGRLFQYANNIKFFVGNADFSDMTVTDAIHQILLAFNLVPSISFTKTALVYRRGNDSGTPQTTGNTVSLTISNTEQIEKDTLTYDKFALLKLSSETQSVAYDGSSFDMTVLSDQRVLEIENVLIPDKIINDITYYMYQFFKTARALYTVTLPNVILFQYEPIDGAQFTYTTTKIQSSSSGVIYAVEFDVDGKVKFEVLI